MKGKNSWIKSFLQIFILFVAIAVAFITMTAACSNINKNQPDMVSGVVSSEVSSSDISSETTTTTTNTTTTSTTTTTTVTTTTTTTAVTTTTPSTTTTSVVSSTTTPTTTKPKVEPTIDNKQVGTVTVMGSVVNIRSSASKSSSAIGETYKGKRFEIIGYNNDSEGKKWYAIKYKEQIGFISAGLVEVTTSGVGTAYLTFDDGPSNNTYEILDILDEYNVKATFFVKYNKDFEDAYKQIVNRGHTIANHTYSHTYSTVYQNDEVFFNDLNKMSDYINSTTGVITKIIRFPGGSSNSISKKYNEGIMTRLIKSVTDNGYTYFDWNIDSGDANGDKVPKSKILANVKNDVGVKNQAVILMHDSPSKTTTVDALPEIIEYLQARGYSIKPITKDTPAVHHIKLNN